MQAGQRSLVRSSAIFHVAAYGYSQPQALDCQAANHECGAHYRVGIQSDRGNREKKSGWHDQQSGVFHRLSFPGLAGRSFSRKRGKPLKPDEMDSRFRAKATDKKCILRVLDRHV
jgi:hypothetical protein